MGLLDDAIREHLELKRRRGADLDEVARQETEALGDPRAPAAVPTADPGGEPEAADGLAAPEPADAEVPTAPAPADVHLAPDADLEAGAPVAQDEPAWLEDELEPLGARPAGRDPVPDLAEPPVAASDRPPGEDVLEETPEFLQETPEHDRLWFEQKPPRPFDFDS